MDTEAVKSFVVHMLGCRCPEEVFHTMEATDNHHPADGIAVLKRINVGNRLLVWLVSSADLTAPAEHLQALVRHGVAERDRGGFNRFRLVLLSADGRKTDGLLPQVLKTVPLPDERVHFHIIPEGAVGSIFQ